MKFSFLPYPVLVASLALPGCQPNSDELAMASTVIVGPEYSANKGLFVPEETRRSLGVKIVEMGEEMMAASVELSLRVYDASGPVIRASGSVTLEQAKALMIGQPLSVRVNGREIATGRIAALSDHMEKVMGTVEVLTEIPFVADWVVGSFVNATVTIDSGERVATVPRSALIQATDGYSVYAVSGTHFMRTPVKVGALNADVAEIKEGLYSGDQVVSEPVMSLWLTELAAVKGGHACCVVPARGK